MSKSNPNLNRALMIQGAQRYALADASDPFAFGRAMAHLRNGIAEYALKDGGPAFYDAEMTTEPRAIPLPNGKTLEWEAAVWRNRVRP